MAIKTEVVANAPKEISYPCLMESIYSELVVLFTHQYIGTVIVSGHGWSAGMYRDDWVCADNDKHWQPSAPVTISNA